MEHSGEPLARLAPTGLSRDEIFAGDVFLCTDRILWVRLAADSFHWNEESDEPEAYVLRPTQLVYFYGDGIWPVHAAKRASEQDQDSCICDLNDIEPFEKIFTKADISLMFQKQDNRPLSTGDGIKPEAWAQARANFLTLPKDAPF